MDLAKRLEELRAKAAEARGEIDQLTAQAQQIEKARGAKIQEFNALQARASEVEFLINEGKKES